MSLHCANIQKLFLWSSHSQAFIFCYQEIRLLQNCAFLFHFDILICFRKLLVRWVCKLYMCFLSVCSANTLSFPAAPLLCSRATLSFGLGSTITSRSPMCITGIASALTTCVWSIVWGAKRGRMQCRGVDNGRKEAITTMWSQ